MDKTFRIGALIIRLRCPDDLRVPENFMKFAWEGEAEYTYDISLEDTLPVPGGRVLAQREDLTVFSTGTGEARLIGVKGNPTPYACYQELAPGYARVTVLGEWADRMASEPVFVSLLALEKRMLERDALVLHTAFIVHKGRAMLFSAPSGTGKSTQADLWQKYRGSRTVNGDRGLLRKVDGIWRAEGWPVCGSSEICFTGHWPIGAIVMLSQAPEDRVQRLTPGAAFSQIYSQTTVNRWSRRDTLRAMDLIEDLAASVPVYHLECTISQQAVACLEKALEDRHA